MTGSQSLSLGGSGPATVVREQAAGWSTSLTGNNSTALLYQTCSQMSSSARTAGLRDSRNQGVGQGFYDNRGTAQV